MGKSTLQQMERMLRLRTGRSLSPIDGSDDSEMLRLTLQLSQEKLNDLHNWRSLSTTLNIPFEGGQSFLDVPDQMDLSKALRVYVSRENSWDLITRGFDARDLDTLVSRSGLVESWDFVSRPDEEIVYDGDPSTDIQVFFSPQIALFPVPREDGVLKIEGYRRLRRFTQPQDVCDLDDQMVVYEAAAAICASENDLNYKVVRAEALRRFEAMVKADNSYAASPIQMAVPTLRKKIRREIRAPRS